MRAEYAKALELYHDGTIDKAGKIEIRKKFSERFSGCSQSLFNKLINDGIRLPTPDEEDFLIENITHYHNRYSEHHKASGTVVKKSTKISGRQLNIVDQD